MVESALTFSILNNFSVMQLARIITGHYCAEDKLKAANFLPLKAKGFMRTREWLALSVEDKNTINEALKYDTTAEGFSAIS